MPESQRRSHSELGILFKESDEAFVADLIQRSQYLVRFWLTYSQTQTLRIEDPEILVYIVQLCVKGRLSRNVAKALKREFDYKVPEEFIDRIYLRIKRLISIILNHYYPHLQFTPEDFELSEEEQRVFNIYQVFTSLPHRINNMVAINSRFAEVYTYNPHYVDFLELFATGKSVPDVIQSTGLLPLNQSKRQAISESIIAALVRSNPDKTLYKEAQNWTVLTFMPEIMESKDFANILQRAISIYINGLSKNLERFTEVRRFIEFYINLTDSELTAAIDVMNIAERNETFTFKTGEQNNNQLFATFAIDFIRSFALNGNSDVYLNKLKENKVQYSDKYIASVLSAGVSLIFSCILLTIYTDASTFTEAEFTKWISRNRNSECSAMLKMLSGVES